MMKIIGVAAIIALTGSLYAQSKIVSTEVTLSFDSRYMTYGVIDGKDPIFTPGATATFFDWAYIGVESIFDLTDGNGKRGGYGKRGFKYTTLDAFVGLAHEFDLGEKIGTLGVDVGYMYEYLPRYQGEVGDTQYFTAELSLGGHWLEPTIAFERDIMADNGTYVNFELGHTFEISEDLTLRPAIGQGVGNSLRTKGYFGELEKVGFYINEALIVYTVVSLRGYSFDSILEAVYTEGRVGYSYSESVHNYLRFLYFSISHLSGQAKTQNSTDTLEIF